MDGNRRDSGCCPFFCARCNPQLVRWKAGFHGRSCLPAPPLHAGDDLHDEQKQGRAAVGKRDEKVRADADGEQD